jgi:hypothetical protein
MTGDKPESAFATIADTLGETEHQPRAKLRNIVAAFGDEAALALLAEVQQIEADGGMMLPDGSRRRTPGGVYFHLAYHRLAPEQRQAIYGYKRHKDGNGTPPPPPATWSERGAWIDEARGKAKEANTVKITLVGTLGKTVEKQNFTLAMMTHTPRMDKLPKGIPRPDQASKTTYIVYIGSKQWRKVKDALRNPEDVAIIEGVPSWDQEYEALAVFATSITTKLTQQAKREAQKAQATQEA